LLCIQFETFRCQVKQTVCFAPSLQTPAAGHHDDDDADTIDDNDDDDADVLDAIKQTVGERAKLKNKVQVSVTHCTFPLEQFVFRIVDTVNQVYE